MWVGVRLDQWVAVHTQGTCVGERIPGAVGGHALTEHGLVGAGLDKLVTMQTHVWVGACLDQWVAVQTHGTWVGVWVQTWIGRWPCTHTEYGWVGAGLDQ